MKKLEYIPGDIVKIEYGEATGKIGFVTNTFLRRKGYYSLVVFIGKGFQGSSKDDWIQTYNDEVSPIPLNTEILEKNGWKNDGYDWYKLPTKRAYLYITKDITTLGEFLVCVGLDRHNLASINFVHQLQHLLFSLELNSEMKV
jgi:hypothetical protein